MKAKRILPLLISLFMVGGAFAGLAGCNNGGSNGGGGEGGGEGTQHNHNYVNWQSVNDTTHKGTCNSTTGTCDAPEKTEGHDNNGTGGICSKCGYDPSAGGEKVDTSTALPADKKIYLVGDSTVCSFNDGAYYLPRYGYGTQISEYFNVTSSQVVNLAASGRSAYSLMTESAANYSALTSGIKAGDYLFIGFGHNDEKSEVARYADPTLDADNETTMIDTYNAQRPVSFKYILKHYYIDVALNAGATPILCTPISRLFTDDKKSNYDSDHTTVNKTVEVSGTDVTFNGGDYAKAIRDLGADLGITVVDLKTPLATEYKALGYAEASKYHAATGAEWADESKTTKKATGVDGTHTNLFGARNNAYYLATAIKSSSIALKDHVKTNITKPTYAEYGEAAVNDNYVIVEKKPFDPETDASKTVGSLTATITDATTSTAYKWYGTVFGAGANPSNFRISQGSDANGTTFTIAIDSGKGKVESGQDIMAAVFIQVPMETAFTMTATAEVSGITGKQSGYGIMVRDDIYVGDYTSTVNSNYLNAGCYTTDSAAYTLYWRVATKLSYSENLELSNANGLHALSLKRLSQNTLLGYDNYSKKLLENEYNLDLSDSQYVYVCLWATRGMSVTYSNITFSTETWEQA